MAGAVLGATVGLAQKVQREELTFQGRKRVCHVVAPADTGAERPLPLLVTLHGSGQPAARLAEWWGERARESGFVVAAPEARNPQEWTGASDGPDFFRAVVEEVASRHPVDRRRVYLFGYSGGGHFGLQIALAESRYFAAAAFCAGALPQERAGWIDAARRRIPVALFAGADDTTVAVKEVRRTHEALQKAGFPTQIEVFPGCDHTYSRYLSRQLHRRVWTFLAARALAADPEFQSYADNKR